MTALALAALLAADRPNVLFVFADDLGYGDIAAHGHPDAKTPHLDRLAAEGTDFHQFCVASGVCSPSRAAVMTGQYPARHRVHGHFAKPAQNAARGMPNHLDPDAPMVSRQLQQAGYATGHFGKWHLSNYGVDAPEPTRFGFDVSAIFNGPGPQVFEGVGKKRRDVRLTQESHDTFDSAVALSPAATDHAEQFIRRHAEEPWYVNLWLHETHQIVAATEEEKAAYPDVPEPHKTYLACVTRADECVGRMLDLLDELGLAENTLVVFSSDNGPENPNPNPKAKTYTSVGTAGDRRGRKRSLYMGGVNVPFLVRWPGEVPAGRVDRTSLLGAVDLFPTFLAAADVEPPADYEPDGVNILPALRGETFERDQPLFWQWNAARAHSPADWPRLGVRDGRFALVAADERVELYDVLADPGQEHDLSESRPDLRDRLITAGRAWAETLPKAPVATLNDAPPRQKAKKPKTDRAAIFRKKDADGDGRLSLAEYLRNFPDEAEGRRRFPGFDADGDGFLTPAEFKAE